MRQVEAFCSDHTPPELHEQMRLECSERGNSITIVELRAPWSPDFGPGWSTNDPAGFFWG